jgi:hypothetical protein
MRLENARERELKRAAGAPRVSTESHQKTMFINDLDRAARFVARSGVNRYKRVRGARDGRP